MVIIDAAHNLKPNSIGLIRQIRDQLKIAVILVGSIRLELAISSDLQFRRRFASRFVLKSLVA
jgi:DNA transposition AAA+ family ATPase